MTALAVCALLPLVSNSAEPVCRRFEVRRWTRSLEADFDLRGGRIARAWLEYTKDHGPEDVREWKRQAAAVSNSTVRSEITSGMTGVRIGIETEDGRTATTGKIAAPVRVEGVRQLVAIDPTKENVRNGEGDSVLLKDGRMLFAYARFTNKPSSPNAHVGMDHYPASIYGYFSPDGGKTWPEPPRELIPNDAGLNLMCVSFLRLKDGRLALFYLRKDSLADCRPMMRVSADEGATWGPAVACVGDAHRDYYVMNNARAIRLGTGRILLPLARHRHHVEAGEFVCAWSDDDGRTWKLGEKTHMAFDGTQRIGAQEPCVIELKDGSVYGIVRSYRNFIMETRSSDGGETWSPFVPASAHAPESPATIARLSTQG